MLCVCVSILPLSYKLIQKPDENQMTDVSWKPPYYYVWDTVAIALHVERGQVLSPPPHSVQQVSLCDKVQCVFVSVSFTLFCSFSL